MHDDETYPWDQLPDEPDEWYARFLTYANLPGKRTFIAAYRAHGMGGPTSKKHGTISVVWREKIKEFDWKGRADKLDIFRHQSRLYRHRDLANNAYDQLYDGVAEAIKTVLAYSKPHNAKGGRKIICPPEARVRLNAALEVLDRLGISKRQARPMYTQADPTDEKPVITIDLGDLTPEQLREIAAYDDEDDADYA